MDLETDFDSHCSYNHIDKEMVEAAAAINLPFIAFELVCGKGTYVRSLAHDLGKKLGVGAYLHTLCRTQIGDYRLEHAWSIETLLQHYAIKNPLSLQ